MKLKPCPFCGNKSINISVHSAMSYEVVCRYYILNPKNEDVEVKGCGARIIEGWPSRLPNGITHKTLPNWIKNRLALKWNKRAKPS